MALHQINVDWKRAATFKTEAGLMRRIEQDKAMYPEHNDRFIIVQTPDNRWTAIVSLDMKVGGYLARYAFLKI